MRFFYKVCLYALVCCSVISLGAQDKVLLTIGGTPVYVSEFEYIYNKNNFNNKADYSKASLDEYLDLYTRFRLKVKEAEARGIDTLPDILSEIESYRQQLFDAYIDKEFTQKLAKLEYERMQKDVSISHILFAFGPGKNENELKAKADEVYGMLRNGASFESLVKQYSDDNFSKEQNGDLGYYTALQMNFKGLEDAAYTLPVGQYSAPIRTPLGYHIIKVNDVRPARGKIKVAMIKRLVPQDSSLVASAELKVDSIYEVLKAGADFAEVAMAVSEDYSSGQRGGELDWFTINTFNPIFEEAAFGLKNVGDISKPAKTAKSWYIIKLLNKTDVGKFEDIAPSIVARLTNHPQHEEVMKHFIDSLQQKYGYTFDKNAYLTMLTALSPALDTFAGIFQPAEPYKSILKIGDRSIDDFTLGNAMLRNTIQIRRMDDRAKWHDLLFNKALRELTLEYHRDQLLKNDRELSFLMKEYRDGILLFDLTEKEVWNKAIIDTAGLQSYYAQHKDKFRQPERLVIYSYHAFSEKDAKKLKGLLLKNNALDTKALTDQGLASVTLDSMTVEKGKALPAGVNWAKGVYGPSADKDKFVVHSVIRIAPEHARTLEEARGFVIAGYQEELEKQWVESLRKKYPVVVNEGIFNSLVK